ncbi:hypothetical protein [Taibaiella koreensis]|uniref:hypothetical protein n=1 Tax=Taibaiella koreensis TaxID=1268548 RepID=UPI000E599DE2|nr:hypothetical protein [Taibaiella koreensis]
MMNNQMEMLYSMLLSVPGMNEKVKIDLRISRNHVLLLAQVMQSGLKKENPDIVGLLSAMPEGSLAEMQALVGDCLAKAELTELNGKLLTFSKAGQAR